MTITNAADYTLTPDDRIVIDKFIRAIDATRKEYVNCHEVIPLLDDLLQSYHVIHNARLRCWVDQMLNQFATTDVSNAKLRKNRRLEISFPEAWIVFHYYQYCSKPQHNPFQYQDSYKNYRYPAVSAATEWEFKSKGGVHSNIHGSYRHYELFSPFADEFRPSWHCDNPLPKEFQRAINVVLDKWSTTYKGFPANTSWSCMGRGDVCIRPAIAFQSYFGKEGSAQRHLITHTIGIDFNRIYWFESEVLQKYCDFKKIRTASVPMWGALCKAIFESEVLDPAVYHLLLHLLIALSSGDAESRAFVRKVVYIDADSPAHPNDVFINQLVYLLLLDRVDPAGYAWTNDKLQGELKELTKAIHGDAPAATAIRTGLAQHLTILQADSAYPMQDPYSPSIGFTQRKTDALAALDRARGRLAEGIE
ncbi:MAG: hypothetical protein GTO22_05215 [Gemmatimonadales bacterium]|nr:hypothetical protein [Gemmatimonadales bacterium]